MEWSPISKPRDALQRAPNLADYPAAYRDFSWDEVRAQLDGVRKLEEKYAARGLELLAVSLDDPGDQDEIVQPFLAKWFPSLRTLIRTSPDMDAMVSVLDPAWNEVLPTSYLVDRNGRVAGRVQGGKSRAEFEAAILPLLGEP